MASSNGTSNLPEEAQKKKKKRTALIVVLSILLFVLLLCLAGVIFAERIYRMTDFEESAETFASEIEETEETGETMADADRESLAAELSKAQEEAEKQKEESTDEVYNILLIGVDRREKNWNGNSDAMILASVNYTDQTIMLTSFMRDLGVNVDSNGLRKLNYAYAVGAGPLLESTIEKNFGVEIDNYAWVDFSDIIAIVDAMGGIQVSMTDSEARYIGVNPVPEQSYRLYGQQTLNHARDRFSSGNDYARTERQRKIIQAMISRLKELSAPELVNLMDVVLPFIHHDLDRSALTALMLKVPKIITFPVSEQRIPYDDTYYSQNEMLIPDYSVVNPRLHNAIYGN